MTETESIAGAVPDAGERPTQNAPDEADQESAPPPAFVIETLCAAGAATPTVHLNVSASGEAAKEAGAAVTVKATATDTGLLDARAADI